MNSLDVFTCIDHLAIRGLSVDEVFSAYEASGSALKGTDDFRRAMFGLGFTPDELPVSVVERASRTVGYQAGESMDMQTFGNFVSFLCRDLDSTSIAPHEGSDASYQNHLIWTALGGEDGITAADIRSTCEHFGLHPILQRCSDVDKNLSAEEVGDLLEGEDWLSYTPPLSHDAASNASHHDTTLTPEGEARMHKFKSIVAVTRLFKLGRMGTEASLKPRTSFSRGASVRVPIDTPPLSDVEEVDSEVTSCVGTPLGSQTSHPNVPREVVASPVEKQKSPKFKRRRPRSAGLQRLPKRKVPLTVPKSPNFAQTVVPHSERDTLTDISSNKPPAWLAKMKSWTRTDRTARKVCPPVIGNWGIPPLQLLNPVNVPIAGGDTLVSEKLTVRVLKMHAGRRMKGAMPKTASWKAPWTL